MNKKRITFLAIGSRGDLNPSCALAIELISRGYDVFIATHENFKSFVTEKGINYNPIPGDYKDILNSEVGIELLEGKGKLRLIDDDLFWKQLMAAYQSCQNTDAIIVFPLSLWGYHIAEKLRVPCICSCYIPLTPTGDFPIFKFEIKNSPKILSPLNYFSYLLVEFLSWQADREIINRFRQKVLNLSPIPFWGTRYRRNPPPNFSVKEIPILYQYSSHVIPRPSDWHQPNYHITGNWFLREEENYKPSSELADFISRDERPIYIGFGSMAMRNPEKIASMLVEVVNVTKKRVIISSGWSQLAEFIPSEHYGIFILSDYVPFDWLFPRMKLLIHHGGSGTTALGLKAGIPQILIPFFADQPAWAAKLTSLGVSPAFIPFQKLSSQKLIKAIETTINDSQIYLRAKKMSAKIKSEEGVKTAATLIEKMLDK